MEIFILSMIHIFCRGLEYLLDIRLEIRNNINKNAFYDEKIKQDDRPDIWAIKHPEI